MRNKQALVSRIALQPIWDPHITLVPFLPPWKRSTILTDKIKEREKTKVERMGLWCHKIKVIWEQFNPTNNTFSTTSSSFLPTYTAGQATLPTTKSGFSPKFVLCSRVTGARAAAAFKVDDDDKDETNIYKPGLRKIFTDIGNSTYQPRCCSSETCAIGKH